MTDEPLLKRYMRLVLHAEGTTFYPGSHDPANYGIPFTEEEADLLRGWAHEIDDQWGDA